MKPASHERVQFWGMTYARSALLEAIDSIAALRKSGHSEAVRSALFTSVVVSYCRMFGSVDIGNGRKWKLGDKYVPKSHRDMHETLLALRNRVIGHKDASEVDDLGNLLSRVILHSDGRNLAIHVILPNNIEPVFLDSADAPCAKVLENVFSDIQMFIGRYVGTKLAAGNYELQLGEAADPWLKSI
jgi:hypothetical protein